MKKYKSFYRKTSDEEMDCIKRMSVYFDVSIEEASRRLNGNPLWMEIMKEKSKDKEVLHVQSGYDPDKNTFIS